MSGDSLNHMLPCYSGKYASYGSFTRANDFCNFLIRKSSGMELMYFSNFPLVQFRPWMVRSSNRFMPSLCHFVGIVFQSGSQKKMSRVAARRIVTFMKNAQSLLDFTVSKKPSMAMSERMLVVKLHSAIASGVFSKFKLPAFFRLPLCHIKPEILTNRRNIIRQSSASSDSVKLAVFEPSRVCAIQSNTSHEMTVDQLIKQVNKERWF